MLNNGNAPGPSWAGFSIFYERSMQTLVSSE